MSKTTTLISVETLKDRSAVHKNMDDTLIIHEIRIAQDTCITPAIGSNLMTRLLEGVENSDATTDENTLIDGYIIDALVQFTLAGIALNANYQMFTKGVLNWTSENTQLPTLRDLQDLSQLYKDRGDWYRERLIKYLRANKSLYPLYSDGCDCSQDISPAKSGYSTMMYLDDC